MKLPKGYRKLVEDLAQLRMITLVCRELHLPLGKDKPEDRAATRAKWKKLRSFHAPEDQPKVRKLVEMVAREMMKN